LGVNINAILWYNNKNIYLKGILWCGCEENTFLELSVIIMMDARYITKVLSIILYDIFAS
jgi:hypothetical protein